VGSYIGPNCKLKPQACTVQDVASVLSGEHVVEDGARSLLRRQESLSQSDKVSLFINGFYKGDMKISSAYVATVDLHEFPDLAALHKPLKLTFKYHEAYAYSVLPQAEVERIFEQRAPAPVHTESR
jgi:hypothetical protein